MYLNPIQSLPLDKHTQKGNCPCILCIKFIRLFYNELTESKTEENLNWNVWYWKQTLTHQKLSKLTSDRALLL